MEVGMTIYRRFFEKFKDLPTAEFKVEHWDAGWWQIKRCLAQDSEMEAHFAILEKLAAAIGEEIRQEALDLEIVSAT